MAMRFSVAAIAPAWLSARRPARFHGLRPAGVRRSSPDGSKMQKAVLARRPPRSDRTRFSLALLSYVSMRMQTKARVAVMTSSFANKLFCVRV